MRTRHRVSRFLILCAMAGVLVAALFAPVVLGLGELSNQVTDSLAAQPAAMVNVRTPLVTTVTDRDGRPIAALYDQYRLPVTYDQISPAMVAAVVSIEDRRFFDEHGIDLRGTARALLADVKGGQVQGASTIAQQYVKNYLINVVDRKDKLAQDLERADSISRKIKDARLAVDLDRSMSKNDILAGYLNLVAFSGQVYGVAAGAHAYFDTTPDKLTVSQAALLAGMVNNPSLYDPYRHPVRALDRRNVVIDAMVTNRELAQPDADQAKAMPLGVVPNGPLVPGGTCIDAEADAGFFCQYVVSYLEQAGFTADQLDTGGYTIRTTMDSAVSRATKAAVEANVPTTQPGVANPLAVIRPGRSDHQVLAMVANRNYGTNAAAGQTGSNIVADASNVFGAGSAFKIFTTAAAMETGKAGFNTNLPNPFGQCFTPPITDQYTHCYPVENFTPNYPNPISLHEALSTSPNVAFVGLETQVGMPAVVRMASRLGLRNTMQTNDAGSAPITDPSNPLANSPQYNQPQSQYFRNLLSFTLGNSPVSPLEMANVSATLLSGGMWCPPTPILGITSASGRPVPVTQQPCEQVVSTGLANTLVAGLSQDSISGTSAVAAKAANWHHADIGKTGTTEQSESVAFVGGVDDYAASSMVFADGSTPGELCPGPPVHIADCGRGAFGGTVAAPPYFQALGQLLGGRPDTPLPAPDGGFMDAGPRGPIVPDVVGTPEAAAKAALQGAGYPEVSTSVSSTAPAGQVVGETPQGDVPTGTTITLSVSTGLAPVVPTPPNDVLPGQTP